MTAQWATEKQDFLGKVRKMKIALTKWRLDYQDVAHQKTTEQVSLVEQKCARRLITRTGRRSGVRI